MYDVHPDDSVLRFSLQQSKHSIRNIKLQQVPLRIPRTSRYNKGVKNWNVSSLFHVEVVDKCRLTGRNLKQEIKTNVIKQAPASEYVVPS